MKKIVFGVLVGFLFAFAGCSDDDGYSLNDMWIGFGILQKTDTEVTAIVMDNKDVLRPVASNYPPGWSASFENGARVLINYTILDEELNDDGSVKSYYVKVNNLDDVLMKAVMDITPENEDSIGNDPIIVKDCWMTDSLLSFKLKYWGYNETHFLNLVKEPGEITADSQPIELELRHNSNGDDESVPFTAFVSFSLNDLRIEGQESVQLVVTSTDYDGIEFREEVEFNYADLDE